jgi:RNA polymerase primary sigma factor
MSDHPLQDLINGSPALKRLLAQARERGVVTHDEINSALPEDDDAPDQLMEQLLLMFDEMGVSVGGEDDGSGTNGSAKDDLGSGDDEAEGAAAIDDEDLGRTDDPVRMYLREMGPIELLSREGEIEIAKRIEAGRNTVLEALCESPLTGD